MSKITYEHAFISDIDGVVVPFIYDDPEAKEKTPRFMAKLESLQPSDEIIEIYRKYAESGYIFYFVTGRSQADDYITKKQLDHFNFRYRLKHTPFKNREQYTNDKITEIERIVKKFKNSVIVDDDEHVHDSVEKKIINKYPRKNIVNVLYPQQAEKLASI